MGYLRNLTAGEILDQVLAVRRSTGKTITNVVFMGMGEPMLNYDAVMQAADILAEGIAVAPRRITISTAGWADGIRRMGDEKRRMTLAVSLHSAVDETRKALMPVARRFPLPALLDAVTSYYGKVKRRITYEVVLFDGINDTPEEIRRLIRFARAVPSKLNVIPYHTIALTHPDSPGATLRPSPRLQAVVQQLREAHLTVMVRSSAGEDISAACGQLVVASAPGRMLRTTHHRNTNRHPSSL
jgi:23S rRNA (adenine2503-C2)-methyltransferase